MFFYSFVGCYIRVWLDGGLWFGGEDGNCSCIDLRLLLFWKGFDNDYD